jgi:O-antigen/teichoic acid export membrane protein
MDNIEQKNNDTEITNAHSKKNILAGTVIGYITFALSIISGLVYTPWIISSIGKSNYGLYTLSSSLIGLFLLDFGLSATANTYFSKLRAKGDKEGIEKLAGVFYKLYLIMDVAIFVAFTIVYFLIDKIYVGLTPDERESFKLVFLVSASFSVVAFPTTVLSGIISAYEEFIWAKVIELINKVLYIVFTAIAISLGWGLLSLVIVNSGTGIVCVLIKYLVVRKKIKVKAKISEKLTGEVIKPILTFSIWAAVSAIANRLIFNITPSILGIVSDSTNISVFGIASTLEGYVYSFGSIMSGFFLPKIARIYDSGKDTQKELLNLGMRVGKIQLAIIGLIEIGFVCCGMDFILLWMKSDTTYVPAFWGTVIMIIYHLIFVPEIVFYTALYASNKVKHLAIIALVKAAINLGLSFWLSSVYGASGACISIAIARVIELILENIVYQKELGVNLKQFFSTVYVRLSLSMLPSLAAGLCMYYFLPLHRFPKFCCEVVGITVVYCLFVYLFGLTKDEKNRAHDAIKARFTRSKK